MNVLEHYIKEIIGVETMLSNNGMVFIKATVVVDCYGKIETKEIYMLPDEWEEAKEKGYYLG